ncbi:vezatin isoform X1 [Cherax quadricarinatus]
MGGLPEPSTALTNPTRSMADTEEDDDVIFEGSAIYQHLLDTGYTDFESTQLKTSHYRENATEVVFSKNKKGALDLLKEMWASLHESLFGKWRDDRYKDIAEYIAQSKLVTNDDWLVLEHFLPGGEELHHTGSLALPSGSNCRAFVFIGSISLLLSVVLPLYISCKSWFSCTIISAFLICMIMEGIPAFIRYFLLTRDIKRFVLLMKEISSTASRSLRLLQEVDLISKGFVLAQGSYPATLCENAEFPQCSNLCSALISVLKLLEHILRENHQYLGECTPEYPCMKQLFDQVEASELNKTACNTECITFLKKWVAIMKLQLSAVLTELLLCIHKPVMLTELCDVRCQLFSSRQVAQVKSKTKYLQNSLEYTRSFWLQDRQEERKPKSFEDKKRDVYIAIHSLSLHMQSALFRVQDLENKFENENILSNFSEDLEQKQHEVLPSYEYVSEQLNALKTVLSLCQGCLEETEARVDRKYGMNDSKVIPKLEDQCKTTDDNISSQKEKIPVTVICSIEEPVIEDEVFEAYIHQEYSDRQKEDYNDDFWTADIKKERQMLRQQKAQGKRVLNELEPILLKRRKMWEQREMAALSRQHTKKAQVVDVDNSKTEQQTKCQRPENFDDRSDDIPEALQQVKREEEETKERIMCKSIVTDSCIESSELKLIRGCESELENGEEVDSNRERLKLYRKLEQELDEDENRQKKEDEEEERRTVFSVTCLKPFESHLDVTAFVDVKLENNENNKYQEDKKHIFCLPASHKNTVNKHNLFEQEDRSIKHYNEVSSAGLPEGETGNVERDSQAVTCDITTGDAVHKGMAVALETEFSTESVWEMNIPTPNVIKDEEFVHNEEIDDSSSQIDWSTIGAPTRQTETLDERMQLFSAGLNIGFQAEVAAEAQAASRRFWATAPNLTETFGGVGECEEVFGSDDDTEDDEVAC